MNVITYNVGSYRMQSSFFKCKNTFPWLFCLMEKISHTSGYLIHTQ